MPSKKKGNKNIRRTPGPDTPAAGGVHKDKGSEGGGCDPADKDAVIPTPDTGMTSIPIGTPMSREELAALKKRAEKLDKDASLPPTDNGD